MRFRQSGLKRWMACPLQAYFADVERMPTKQGSKAAFGSVIHAALEQLTLTGDLASAEHVFTSGWDDPSTLGLPEIEVWNKFSSFGGLRQRGLDILRVYASRMDWDQRTLIATEHRFLVPFGKHELTGTMDRLEVRRNHKGKEVLLVVDYKSTTKRPSIAELALDIQFCADETTEVLTHRGWLTFDGLIDGDQALTLNQDLDVAEWQPILGVHTFPTQSQELISIEQNGHSSLTTANHRWPVEHTVCGQQGWRRERRVVTSDRLGGGDRIPCAAPVINLPTNAKWDDAFVELVAWFWTEGHWTRSGASVAQSDSVNPQKVARIRGCLTGLFGPAIPSLVAERGPNGQPAWRETPGADCNRFYINQKAARLLRAVLDKDKVVGSQFVAELTEAQLRLFIDTSIDADGTTRDGVRVITQSLRERLDPLQMACSLAGIRTSVNEARVGGAGRYAGRPFWRMALWETRRHFVPAETVAVEHSGMVWCPRTANQTWLARRNGTVYFTGNTTYIYATTQPEFWLGNGDDYPPVINGEWYWETLKDIPRRGLWVHLWDDGKEIDAGERDEDDFGRLYRLCDEIERAITHKVFVPRIGDACQVCDFANGPCPVEPPSREWWETRRIHEDEASWAG